MTTALGAAVCVLAGCEREEITRYQLRRLPTAKSQANLHDHHDHQAPQRILALILPHGERTWFVKLSGPPEAVGEHRQDFARFISSIAFDRQGKMVWDVPEGWEEQPASGMRYATFHLGPSDQPLELTVTSLGREAAAVLPNVNRWRGQIGLHPVGEEELDRATTRVQVAGVEAILVDMAAEGETTTEPAPPLAASKREMSRPTVDSPTPSSRLSYDTPADWKEDSAPRGMRVASFQISQGYDRAEVTVIPLDGAAGGLLSNVNRWRDQIGLAPVTGEQLRSEVEQIDVAGTAGHYVHLIGPESAEKRQRILGVIVVRGERTWFFKMTGPADLVGKQRAAFEAFVRSVRFPQER